MLLRPWGTWTTSYGAGDVKWVGKRACRMLCFYRWESKEDKEEVESQEVGTWTEDGKG